MNTVNDQNKLNIAIEWIKKLANGINPTNGIVIPDNDVVNDVHISRCLFYVAEILEGVGQKKSSSTKQYNMDFSLSHEDLSKVYITDKCSISVFVREINKVVPEAMKPLSVSIVLNWLVNNGYMDEVSKGDGHKTRIPTNLGKSIGISTEMKTGPNGEYSSVIYDSRAQRFILDNLLKEKV